MSPLRAWLTPAARAALEAVLAKLAAPGMADPDSEHPVLDGTPSQEAIDRDTRTPAQRNHDGLLHAALRAVLASGKLGQHNGLPASIIVSTTLKDLEAGTGTALTGGGTLLPMKVGAPPACGGVIRLAAHARIVDNRVLRLIAKWLNAGVIEDGRWTASDDGAPQGASGLSAAREHLPALRPRLVGPALEEAARAR